MRTDPGYGIDEKVATSKPRAGDDPALTAVRGIAALWVFVYHAWVTAGPQLLVVTLGSVALDLTSVASVGWAGVDIFYVLSGFLLWGLFDEWASRRSPGVPLARYAERRALRILPPYWGQLAVLAALGFATTLVDRPTFGNVVSHVLLVHAWTLEYLSSMNGVWWTLSIEAQYYVALPMIAWLIRRVGWTPVVGAALIVTVVWRVNAFEVVRFDSIARRVWLIEQLPGHIDQFLLGMLAQHLARAREATPARLRAWLSHPKWRNALMVAVGPATFVALAYLLHQDSFYLRYWDGHPWLFFWHTTAAMGVATTLYALAIRGTHGRSAPGAVPPTARGNVLTRALVGLGTVSYSFYLWHEVLLRWVGPHIAAAVGGPATRAAFVGNLTLGFALSLGVATGWYLLLERPFLRQRARLRGETAVPAH